jgi:GH24 family phage-related lysozyme (muramidase)
MAWLGGFAGDGYSRAEFQDWLKKQPKPTWVRFLAIHATGAPYTIASVGASTRMKNLANYYKTQQKWKGGPHFFAMGTKIYPGTPVQYASVHSPSWNNIALAIECEGDYRATGKHSHLSGPGAINWDTMAWTTAELLQWLGLGTSAIKFHKEDPRTSHRECPGNIDKDWFVARVKEAMGGAAPKPVEPVKPHPGRTVLKKGMSGGDVPVLQLALNEKGANPRLLVDGDFGLKTESALRHYQASTGLVADGVCGPLTWAKLASAANSEAPKPEPVPDVPVLVPVAGFKTSQKGLDLIKHFEGLRLTPYDDNGSLAIGYGHSNRSKRPPVVTSTLTITVAEAERILADDLVDYENAVKKSIAAPLKQHQFDALVSIAYNWGPGNLDRSELKDLVNAGKHKEAEAEIRTILPPSDKKYFAGIKRRRNQEADLYGGK